MYKRQRQRRVAGVAGGGLDALAAGRVDLDPGLPQRQPQQASECFDLVLPAIGGGLQAVVLSLIHI